MASWIVGNPLYADLLGDGEVAALFSQERMLRDFTAFEGALSRALGAPEVADRMRGFTADAARIRAGMRTDGVPVPDFLRQLRAYLGTVPEGSLHVGATSQDLMDTSLALSLRELSDLLSARVSGAIAGMEALEARFGVRPMMGRTRMQAALPINVADRLRTWRAPLAGHLTALDGLRPRVERVQYGGPVGLRGPGGDAIAAELARAFGLHEAGVWHTQRAGLAAYAGWLAGIGGTLGKIGQDVTLMAQQGVDEIVPGGGGTSSAMAHKRNPVAAETLVTLARFSAVQVGGMHHAMIHEQERSGAAWTLEWLILPPLAEAVGRGLTLCAEMLGDVERIGGEV